MKSTPAQIGLAVLLGSTSASAQLAPHNAVAGTPLQTVTARYRDVGVHEEIVDWSNLSTTHRTTGTLLLLMVSTPADVSAVEIPACANLTEAVVNDKEVDIREPGPKVVDLPLYAVEHRVQLRVKVSEYEPRVACSYAPRVGKRVTTIEGLSEFSFSSVHAREGGGRAVVFIPKGHDMARPSALLVGLHPWNGSIWTYAAYADLLREADAKDVVLLFPSGLGNSLYTEHAETEVLTAIDELSNAVAIDKRRVSLWGASMGGAGATTIGFHHPDRFATITSFFGDSKYDLHTYVRAILKDEAGAHAVNALDVADNARNVPVWLIHGEADVVSPIAQSAMLASVLEKKGFAVRFDRVPGIGHSGMLVTRFIAEIVDRAAEARVPEAPKRVSFALAGPYDGSAYGIRFTRDGSPGDAAIDVELVAEEVHVHRARGVRKVAIPRGAFGLSPNVTVPVIVDDATARARKVDVRWDPLPSDVSSR
jgi:pimeloyl-ACP methyl ester carboxylesterase